MAKGKIRIAIAGVGNCASSLVQGLTYYKDITNNDETVPGLMHNVLGGYRIGDIKVVAAFDVDKRKVGRDVAEAIFSPPNCTQVFCRNVAKTGAVVQKGPVLDGIAETTRDAFLVDASQKPVDVTRALREAEAEILINYLPVGSEEAVRHYARAALDAGCAFINCMPVFIASDESWARRFEEKGLPVIGDDVKSQVGSTILHRMLARLFLDRGVKVERTYQLNVGGNSVTGDQPVMLLVDGEVRYGPIGAFIDELMKRHKIVRADGKEIVIGESLPQTIECLTVDDRYRVRIAHVDAFIRHRLGEPLFEIETDEGRKAKITADHNVFVLNQDGVLQPVPVKDLKEGETYIAVPAALPVDQKEKKTLDLTPYVSELHAEGVDNGLLKIHGHAGLSIPVAFPISDAFLQVVGLWLADGSYDRGNGGNIELACADDPECLRVVEEFCNQFNVNAVTRKSDGIAVRVMSKTLGSIFRQAFGLRGDAYTKRVPAWVFDLSDRQIGQVLKGYVSGDGEITGTQIRWTSVCEGLIEDIRTLFLRLGINTTVFKEKYAQRRGGGYPSAVGHCWHGLVTAQEDIVSFVEKVGFHQAFKNQKALELANRERARKRSRHLPNAASLRKKWRIKSTTWYWNPTVSVPIVQAQLHKIKDRQAAERLRDACEGDVKFLKIRKITKLEANEPVFVYDISTKPFERFVCSNILVHNTDFLNMLERQRLKSKKISKTSAVQSQFPVPLDSEDIHIGPSDYVPWLKDKKLAFIRVEGRKFGDVPINLELRLDVEDSPNSAGIVVDAIRCAKLGLDRKIGGALVSASSYFMKHPPQQFTDAEARQALEEFIMGLRER